MEISPWNFASVLFGLMGILGNPVIADVYEITISMYFEV